MFEREREVFMRKLFGKRMSKELGGIVKAWESTVRKSHIIAKKRANSFLPTMSVAHAEDEDEDEDEDHAIKVLPNGDMYNGQWADNFPHGQGKYLWTDGCMYFGEWFKGKTTGKGRFSWPSGATYEGEFKNGFMDGHGTYTGVGGTYKGCWVRNLKHGKGTKSYDNGDYYDGEWRKGMQEGQGRYQWENGNHYIGQWRNGLMNGNGTMIWTNGNRYDGFWEGGLPKGNGTFRWADGSFYVGFWSMDSKEQSGTYYPPGSEVGNLDWDPQEVFSICSNDCNICPGEKILTFPSQKMPDWCGAEGNGFRQRRMSADGRLNTGETYSWGLNGYANGETVDGNSGAGGEGEEGLRTTPKLNDMDSSRPTISQQIRLQPARRQGETISKGHKNYDLMLNLQLGIR